MIFNLCDDTPRGSQSAPHIELYDNTTPNCQGIVRFSGALLWLRLSRLLLDHFAGDKQETETERLNNS